MDQNHKKATNLEIKFQAIFWDIFHIFQKQKFGGFGGWVDEICEKPKAADTI